MPDFASYFDNGPAPNSAVTVTFANGQVLDFSYPESPLIVEGRVVVSQSAPAIPEPSAALLFAIGAVFVRRATVRGLRQRMVGGHEVVRIRRRV